MIGRHYRSAVDEFLCGGARVRYDCGYSGEKKLREVSMAAADLDSFDRKILRILQRDNMTSQREIAYQVNLSAAAVHRRIHRLHADGIVTANMAVLSPSKIGRPISVIVELEVESERPEELDQVKRSLAAAPEVQQCYYVTGEVDFIVIVSVADMSEYEEITKRLFFANPNIKKFRTYVAMDRVKTSFEMPVD
ncbi:transcriptional regulator, AsnC family [Rhizorhabdus wittichii RW1]|uniref:Transcriptional regulator, AsnC family n=2 Tax=Rhizorhabdus wittichii TaxID=160791 RepID=A0A9J9HAV8_RHIWR|nr:transcriptional regulator, AsnC family [Rhizorhabdus wittichii RW1]